MPNKTLIRKPEASRLSSSELVDWAARALELFEPDKLYAPRGWNKKTLSSRNAFEDEYMKRQILARDEHDDLRLLAEVSLVLGKGSVKSRIECIEILKAPPRPGRKRGPAPYSNMPRDIMIFTLVDAVCALGDLRPTRNDASSDNESGCSIVSLAMTRCGTRMPEKTVAGIYQRYQDGLAESRRAATMDR